MIVNITQSLRTVCLLSLRRTPQHLSVKQTTIPLRSLSKSFRAVPIRTNTNNMAAKLYVDDRSPPVRSVLMLIDELGIGAEDVSLVHIDLFKREQFSAEYLAISPQHSVPALQHDGLTLNDSHSILIHLAQRHGTASALLPPVGSQLWLEVLDRLLFNATTLFRRDSDVFTEIFISQPTDISHHLTKLRKLFDIMETFLGRTKFIACDHVTVADLSVVATVSTINILLRVDADKWPRLAAWFAVMQTRPSYRNANEPGLKRLRAMVEAVAKCELAAE